MKGLIEELGGTLFLMLMSRSLYEVMDMFFKTAENMAGV